jgi:hypothetical protein
MPFPRVAGLFVGSERWSGLGCLPGACTTAHRSFKVCCRASRKLNEFFVHCSPVEYFVLTSAAIEALAQSPLFWDVSFENLEPADLGDCFNAVRIIRVSGEKPVPSCAAYVSCSVGLFQVPEGESETGFATVPGLAAV